MFLGVPRSHDNFEVHHDDLISAGGFFAIQFPVFIKSL
jgi:hypothetical protein